MTSQNHQRGAKAPLLGSEVTLFIEKLAIGGNGVARHEGMVIFVPRAAPQEEVLARITLVKKNFAEAEILEVLKPSVHRRTPPCPVAHECGGCNWQHLTEEEQRRQKHSLVLETLKKFTPTLDFNYLPLDPSPRVLRYRNRIQPKFNRGRFGFFARNSHDIVDINDCLITEEALVKKIPQVREWIMKRTSSNQTQRLEMYMTDNEDVRFGLITEEDDGVGFSQVNRFQNENLVRTAVEWAGDENYNHVYDLYSGAGNFTFPLAEKYSTARITGVELNGKLVTRGKEKATDSRIEFIRSDVDKYLLRHQISHEDLVILDPPRAGCSEASMKALALARPKKIIYISCHPVSLARDLKWFFSAAQEKGINWKLDRVQTFEMFPQTDHVETIAELRVDS